MPTRESIKYILGTIRHTSGSEYGLIRKAGFESRIRFWPWRSLLSLCVLVYLVLAIPGDRYLFLVVILLRYLFRHLKKSFCSLSIPIASLIYFVQSRPVQWIQELIAIANRSRVSCVHNTLMAFIGLNITPWPWNQVKGHSRSLKTKPLDRSYTTYYYSSYLTLNIIVILKCGLEVTQGHWKWYHSKVWVQFPIRLL